MRNNAARFIIALMALCTLYAAAPAGVSAKIYIDIVSSPRKLPIAVQEFSGLFGKDLTEIISADLFYSGLFLPIDKEAFIEPPHEPFRQGNWTGTGAEAVLKGSVTGGPEGLLVNVSLYDVFEGKAVLEKNYNAGSTVIRPLAHSIADDVYRRITGQDSVFKTRIAYITGEQGRHELNLADWDGMRSRKLGITATVMLTPHWSGDAAKLVYSAQRHSRWSIYMIDFQKKKESLIFTSRGVNMAGDFFPGGGSFVLSSSRQGSPDLYIFDLESRKPKKITWERGIEVTPAVSPDGKSIAFVSDSGGSPQIYSIDKFGYNKTRITFEGSYNTSPVWSPRGNLLAFCGRHNGKNQIFTVRPDGSDLRLLTEAGNNEDPSFSPDGRLIAFTSDRDGGKGVYIMRIDGEAQKKISPPGTRAFGPRWSP